MKTELVLLLLAVLPASASGQTGGAAPERGHPATLEPLARFSTDSDGNRAMRVGFSARTVVADSVTVGATVSHLEVSDGLTRVAGLEGSVSTDWRPSRALLVHARGGALRRSNTTVAGALEPVAQLRLRWRPAHGPSLDLRARHEPLAATPQLLAAPVVLSEARATVELPVVSGLHARGMTRYGRLRATTEENTRTTWGAGPVLRLATVEFAGSWAQTTYARPSTAGYFAPRRIDALDAGVYLEHYGWWPVTLVVDVGGGMERVTVFAERSAPPRMVERSGEWRPALRLWSQGSWEFTDHSELRLELEAYETQAGDVVAAGNGGWRWASLGLSLIWRP